jgi:hypothetical protein
MRKRVTSTLPPEYAALPLLIKRPTAQRLFDKSLKWFQRREASGELTQIRKNQGVVSYRRDELLRALGLLKAKEELATK